MQPIALTRPSAADPYHEPAGSEVAWTMGNISEAFPGVATPLSWSFFGPACEAGMRRGFHAIGALGGDELPAPDDVGERFTAVVLGRAAGNIDLMARMAERMPGVDPELMERQLFGEVRDVARHPTRRRYPVIAAKMPVEVLTALPRLRRLRGETRAWWKDAVGRIESPGGAGDEVLRATLREASDLFARNMALHTTVSMIGSGVFEQVEALAAASGGTVTAPELVTGHGTVEEGRIAEDLWAISRGRTTLAAFMAEHGYQGPDAGQLHVRVWRERPESVERLVAVYRGMAEDESPVAQAARQRASRERAEAALLGALGGPARARARAVLAMAARWVSHREMGKAGYLIAVDGARAAARALGRRLAADGTLEDPEDVFFLTLAELLGPAPAGAGALVAERRARRDELLAIRLPDAWVGEPVAVPAPADDVEASRAADGAPVEGIGVNPGVVEGRARVVRDPAETDVEAGEILVCATTDPSWVSLFLAAAGVVIDIGGHMSHGAIVAREMGIPCVINTRDGTSRIRTGDRLRMDGAAGVVTVLERSGGVDATPTEQETP